jgi:hypothetical protein
VARRSYVGMCNYVGTCSFHVLLCGHVTCGGQWWAVVRQVLCRLEVPVVRGHMWSCVGTCSYEVMCCVVGSRRQRSSADSKYCGGVLLCGHVLCVGQQAQQVLCRLEVPVAAWSCVGTCSYVVMGSYVDRRSCVVTCSYAAM